MYPVPENCGRGTAMLLLFLTFISLPPAWAQCISVGPNSPATSADVSFTGSDYSFHNPLNALVNDNSTSWAASLASLFNRQTNYLQVKNFGFNIPAAATICGIEAQIVKSAADIDILIIGAYVRDYDVRIIKNNALTGSNLKHATEWGSSPAADTYGGVNELWGTTWSPADVNSNNFGLSISAEIKTGIGLLPVVNIDYMGISVYYLDPSLLSAQALQLNVANGSSHSAILSWKQSSANDATSFIIERSVNGLKWTPVIGTVQKNSKTLQCTFKDAKPLTGKSFYRLKLINTSGNVYYSTSLPFELTDVPLLTCYPNPFASVIQVKGLTAGERVAVTNIMGQRVYISQPATATTLTINMNDLQPGMYVFSAGNRKMKVAKR